MCDSLGMVSLGWVQFILTPAGLNVAHPLQKNGVTKRLITELPTPTEDPILPEEPSLLAEPPVMT